MSEKTEKYIFKNFDEYRTYLDSKPEDDWLQTRSLGAKSHTFIPVFITEANADVIYREWNVIDEKYMQVLNGIACTVKIIALPDYPEAEQITFTGTAAVPFKEKAGNAIEFDVPSARERAIAKAFATLGNIFGRSLNRIYKANVEGSEKTVIIQNDFSFLKKTKKDA